MSSLSFVIFSFTDLGISYLTTFVIEYQNELIGHIVKSGKYIYKHDY